MIEAVFVICALMSILCVVLLTRGYRTTGKRLLLWSSLCFGFLALNNIFFCVDLLVLPTVDLNGPLLRNILSAISGCLMLIGLIMEFT